MTDLSGYLNTATNHALRSVVAAEEEFILGWCELLGLTVEELAERFDLRSETSPEYEGETLRFITRMKLEPKDQTGAARSDANLPLIIMSMHMTMSMLMGPRFR